MNMYKPENMEDKPMNINLVSEIAGSIVSDKMLNKVDDLTTANRMIGTLEGELQVANQLLDQSFTDMERQVEEASTNVHVTIVPSYSNDTPRTLTRDRWGDLVYATQNNPMSIEQITIDKERISELADAAVKGQAKKEVDEAKEKVVTAEKRVKSIEMKIETVEKFNKDLRDKQQKNIDEERKQLKKTIETAVEREEKHNRKEIATLNLDIKALNAEADLMVDEKENLARERDLAFEVYDAKIRLLENRDSIQNRSSKTILDSIKNRMSMWSWNKKINRLES